MSDAKEIELDRMYTVPLARAWIAPRHRRAVRAVNMLKEFAYRHMKSFQVKIDTDLNELLWDRGMTRPPRRIKVRMTKDEDELIRVSLPPQEEPQEEPEVLQSTAEAETGQTAAKLAPRTPESRTEPSEPKEDQEAGKVAKRDENMSERSKKERKPPAAKKSAKKPKKNSPASKKKSTKKD